MTLAMLAALAAAIAPGAKAPAFSVESSCGKKGTLLSFAPAEQFQLQSGEGKMTSYKFNKKVIDHLFCSTCGVTSFARGSISRPASCISRPAAPPSEKPVSSSCVGDCETA